MPQPNPAEHFRPGHRLGPYTLLCPLASGGMGTVWAAALRGAKGFSKIVAVKTLLQELADEVQYARALRDEAQVAASLSHPNLCEVVDLAEADGYPFLAMEWVDGATLDELLRSARSGSEWVPIGAEAAAQIVADACAGLHALHEACDHAGVPLGAVHRDVSPHNVLIDRRGEVKVSDLGVAKARGQWRARTRSGELRGKLGFLAPEQLLDGAIDRRVDVHAMGCVLYLCLTGSLPYPADFGAFDLVLKGRYAAPRQLRSSVPAALEEIVVRALQSRPDERYSTAHEMRRALEDWAQRPVGPKRNERIAECLHQRLGASLEARRRRISEAFDCFVLNEDSHSQVVTSSRHDA